MQKLASSTLELDHQLKVCYANKFYLAIAVT